MNRWYYFVIGGLAVTVLGLAAFLYISHRENVALEQAIEQAEQSKTVLRSDNEELREELQYIQEELALNAERAEDLEDDLREEKDKFDNLNDRVSDALGTVGVLQRLKELDEELLKKYSRVSFLNENYFPDNTTDIKTEYLYNQTRPMSIKTEVEPFLNEMIEDAADDGLDLRIISAYRSFGQQAAIKSSYVITYGETAANQFSADQGFSEHQLGTTVDFTTPEVGSNLSEFKNTEEYEWLERRAYRYGFVLSYPEDNQYYISEPWHWRFVGKDLARDLHQDEANFYDWDQREIDEYLIDIFED